jgi:hypothetical protein
MSCSSITLKGINTGCTDNLGSIKEVYVIKKNDVTSISKSEDVISTITLNTDSKFSTYKFRKGTSSMSTNMTVDEAVGTMAFTTEIALQFNKLQTSTRLELMALAMDDLVAIVKDGNDKYWYLGYDFPVTVSSMTANSGTNFTDFQGYNITLTDTSRELPFEVDGSIMADLIKPAPTV